MKPYVLTFSLSEHEIGQYTFQVVEQMDEDHDSGDSQGDDQVLGLEKEEREKQKAQGKGDIHRSSLFLVIKTPSGCDHI